MCKMFTEIMNLRMNNVKKFFAAIFFAIGIFNFSLGFCQSQISYPIWLDTNTSGASSAPKEINHDVSPYFKHLDFYNMKSSGNLTILTHYPTYQQTTEYTCGGAAVLTMLYWYGNKSYNEMSLTKALKTRPYPYGTHFHEIVNFFKSLGWQVKSTKDRDYFSRYDDFKDFLLRELRAGHPILVENVEWGGHYRVIIGYDTIGTDDFLDDVLIFMDSYDTSDHKQDGYAIQNGERFFNMWFDHSMLKESDRYQPWIVAYPKSAWHK